MFDVPCDCAISVAGYQCFCVFNEHPVIPTYREVRIKRKKGPFGVDRFTLVNIQSGQPLVICMGHWVAIDIILVSLFMKAFFSFSLQSAVLCPYLIKGEDSRYLVKQEECVKGRR